jgi:hypothetical protein
MTRGVYYHREGRIIHAGTGSQIDEEQRDALTREYTENWRIAFNADDAEGMIIASEGQLWLTRARILAGQWRRTHVK